MFNHEQKPVVKMSDIQPDRHTKVHLQKNGWADYSDYARVWCIYYLWLREHVQTPGAHLAISGDAYQVVSVLGADHIDAVNRVLPRQRRRAFTLKLHPEGEYGPAAALSTVCAAADRGVLCTGVLLLLLLSHRTIWPEYVPPTTTLGWNLANAADMTADCQIGKQRMGKQCLTFPVHVYIEVMVGWFNGSTCDQWALPALIFWFCIDSSPIKMTRVSYITHCLTKHTFITVCC